MCQACGVTTRPVVEDHADRERELRVTDKTCDPAESPAADFDVGSLTVTFWAAARAAAGVITETFPIPVPSTVAALVETIVQRHDQSPKLARVIAVSTVLVNDSPRARQAWHQAEVAAGDHLEVLPPFAGR